MSGRVSTEAPLRKYQRRKVAVNLDLSLGLPGQASAQVGSSSRISAQTVQPVQLQNAPTPIDVDAFDDEVLISSARAFAEAKNNSRRSRTTNVVVDVDSAEAEHTTRFTNCYKRRRNSLNCRPVSIDQVFINLDARPCPMKDRCVEQPKTVPPPPPPPEPTFCCPICMGELVEESSTKCGHIFCKKCIDHAISVKNVCPTCRKKVYKKDVRRIYLPTTR